MTASLDHGSRPPFRREAASRVAAKAEFSDLRLVSAYFDNHDDEPLPGDPHESGTEPFFGVAGAWGVDRDETPHRLGCLFRFEVRFEKEPSDGQDEEDEDLGRPPPPYFIGAEFRVTYLLSDLEGIDDEDLDVFGYWNGLLTAWPYWREFVASMAQRAALPDLAVPVFRVPHT